MIKHILLWCCVFLVTDGFKVLLFFPITVRSLTLLGEGIARHLLEAGHEVTLVTGFPKNKNIKNFREIDISDSLKIFQNLENLTLPRLLEEKREHDIDVDRHIEPTLILIKAAFDNPNFKNILTNTNEKFDVVISELYENQVPAGLSLLYDCPMIWSWSMGPYWQILELIDESANPAHSIDYISPNVLPLSFRERVLELWIQVKRSFKRRFKYLPIEEEIYRSYIGPLLALRGKALPPYQDIIYNASLIIGNYHNAWGNNPRLPQNYKNLGGYHIETPIKLLPEDLQTIMDNATNGVIYFSLGSTLQSKDLPKVLKRELIEVFGGLKQTVIWKFEGEFDNLPNNLHVIKWAPQSSILAHPNCILFISHGGLLSTLETIHHGVPVIGIPAFLDQFFNVRKAVNAGYGLKVDLSYNMAKDLKTAIMTMLSDQKYRDTVKSLSAIYHHRPTPPGKELVHWVEHVVMTRGALHLRSPALMVPWYQKMYLDLVAVILVVLILLRKVYIMLCLKINLYRRMNVSKKIE